LKKHVIKIHNDQNKQEIEKFFIDIKKSKPLKLSGEKKLTKNPLKSESENESKNADNISIICEQCNEFFIDSQHFVDHCSLRSHRINLIKIFDNVQIIESAFKYNIVKYKIQNIDQEDISIVSVLQRNQNIIQKLLNHEIEIHRMIKIQIIIFAKFEKFSNTDEIEKKEFNFQTKLIEFVIGSDFEEIFIDMVKNIDRKLQEFHLCGSNWSLSSINYIVLNVNKLRYIRGRGQACLPNNIKNKRAVINVCNSDNRCFLYSIAIGKLYKKDKNEGKITQNPHRVSARLRNIANNLKYNQHHMPMTLKGIKSFEILNQLSVNVFGLEKNEKNNDYHVIGPLYHTSSRIEKSHFNLLMIDHEYDEYAHFCYITDISRLISKQNSSNGHKIYVCDGCLHIFYQKVKFEQHIKSHDCIKKEIQFPKDGEKMEFTNFYRQIPIRFVIAADFESFIHDDESADDNILSIHSPALCVYNILNEQYPNDSFLSTVRMFKDENICEDFIRSLLTDANYIYQKYLKTENNFDPKPFEFLKNITNVCGICHKDFIISDEKASDT
jgi:hypothetical protein